MARDLKLGRRARFIVHVARGERRQINIVIDQVIQRALERRVGRLVTLRVSLLEAVYDLAPHATSRTASAD